MLLRIPSGTAHLTEGWARPTLHMAKPGRGVPGSGLSCAARGPGC